MVRIRPRLSLPSAMLLITIASMSIVIMLLWRDVGPLRTENKLLHEERGTLVISDPDRLHAIKIPARFAGKDRHSFRVYVPPRQSYVAFVQVNNIPKSGLPELPMLPDHAGILGRYRERLFARLGAGEHTVTIRTVRRGDRADIELVVHFASPTMSLVASALTPKDQWPTVTPETYAVFGDGVGATITTANGTDPQVLLRQRILGVSRESANESYTTPEPDFPLDGVLLWLEPAS